MKQTAMKQTQFYGAVAMSVLLIFLAAVLPGMYARMTAPVKQSVQPIRIEAKIPVSEEEAAGLSIDKVKEQMGEVSGGDSDISGKGPSTLAQVYAKYPDATVGNNIVASWTRVKPEDKEKVYEQLDKEISQAQEKINLDPKDKSAKSALFIASTLKKLCKNNFDYNFLETVPEEEGGLLKRPKKTPRP